MPSSNHQLETLGDTDLAELTRADDLDAFAELWRRHAGAGTTAARQFTFIADPQDIVSEAYLRILRALQQGGGPHEAFRPYLYRTIRNIALDWRARTPAVSLEETPDLREPGPPIDVAILENTVTAKAYAALPERWQAVLWYLEVEGMTPTEAAPLLGLSANATSVLAGRAQEGFKKAWLQAHVNDRSVPAECQWTTERMSRYVRRSLTRRSMARFDRHLEDCDRCALLVQEIGELGGHLASVLLPVALGATAGSLLLGQLRDHAGAAVASTIAPIAVPTAGAVVTSAAAAVLIASVALVGPSTVTPTTDEAAPPPSSAASDESTAGASQADQSAGGNPSSVVVPPAGSEQPNAVEAPSDPVAAVPVSPEPAAPPPTSPAAPAPPAPTAPLIDLSVSLLSGTVELDAVIDLNPSTGLHIELLPGLSLFGR